MEVHKNGEIGSSNGRNVKTDNAQGVRLEGLDFLLSFVLVSPGGLQRS